MKGIAIIEETEKRIESILADREKELVTLDGLIRKEAAAVSAANESMEKATAEGNLEAYRSAKSARTTALDAKEMYEARKEALIRKPLISREEYEKTVSSITSYIAGIEGDAKKTLCSLSDQMEAVSLDLLSVANAANDVLRRLQHDIYRDADRTRNQKTGEVVLLNHEEKHVDPFSTISWGRRGVTAPQYEAYTGRKAAL